MTVQEVRDVLAAIEADKADDESAHGSEDQLRHAVLEAIANGAPNALELAAEVLKSSEIRFSRWCA